MKEALSNAMLTPRPSTDRLGHDLPLPTTKTEFRAWYTYDWANGAWFYVAMNFLPLLVTAQARQVSIQQYTDAHCTTDCDNYTGWAENYETEGTCSNTKYTLASACLANRKEWTADLNDDAKTFDFGGIPLGVASVAQYCTTISVILQLILFISLGSMADYGGNRKLMFMITNSIGILAAFLVVFMAADDLFWVNGLLYIVGVVCFSFAQIFYNAYLPLLVGALPKVIEANVNMETREDIAKMEREATHEHSLRGFAAGFCGQLLVLILVLPILLYVTNDDYLAARLTVVTAGLWILLFSTYTFVHLHARPAPPLPEGDSYIKHSASQMLRTLKSFKKLRQLGVFLVAYFIFSDGTSTIATSAAIFAQEELAMTQAEILLGLIEVSIFAVVGCFFFKWIHDRFGVPAKRILIFNLCMMAFIPIYGVLSMESAWEFYVMIFFFGINTGSQQAFTRSMFAHNLPYGREAEYFSFYEVTNKGTAWLGPLTVALVNQATGSYRSAFSTLIAFFVVGITILVFFDPDLAEKQKQKFDEEDREVLESHHSTTSIKDI